MTHIADFQIVGIKTHWRVGQNARHVGHVPLFSTLDLLFGSNFAAL